MSDHQFLTEQPEVRRAQEVLDAAREASRSLQPGYDSRFRAWEAAARRAVAEGKAVPPRPPYVPSDQEKWDVETRLRLAGQNYDEVLAGVADEVESAVFARHDEIAEELAALLSLVSERAEELMNLGHTATKLDIARGLRSGPGGREHISGRLDPYLILKTVERGEGFLDWKSKDPSPAGGAR